MFDDPVLHAALTEADARDDAWDADWEDWPSAPDAGPGEVSTGRRLLHRAVAEQRCAGAAAARQVGAIAGLVALYAGRGAPDAAARAGAVGEVADEVGAALGLTGWSAARLVERAAQLGSVLPATLAALASGGLDAHRAGMIADATALLSGEHAGEVDGRLCGPGGRALGLTSGQLRPVVRDVVAEVDAAAVVRRSRAAVAARRVGVQDLEDGMAELVATGPAPAVHAMREAIGALGRAGQDAARNGTGPGDPWAVPGVDGAVDPRGLDAHRFDALHDALVGAAADGAAAAAPSAPTLLVGLSTLLGVDDACGQLPGHGPVPAWMARLAARGARLRRVMTDPFTGALVSVDGHTYPPAWLDGPGYDGEPPDPDPDPGPGPGPAGPDPGEGLRPASGPPAAQEPVPASSAAPAAPSGAERPGCTRIDPRACPVGLIGGGPYRVPAALARFVRTSWDRCTAPRCRRPAAHTDLDHVVAHPAGPTCGCNLAPLCRYHHLMKHGTPRAGDRSPRADWARRAGTRRRRWAVHRCSDGHQHWTSPLGQRHVVAPPRLLTAAPPDAGSRPGRPPTSTGPLDPLCYPRGAAEWRPGVATSTATGDRAAQGTRDEPPSDGFRERLAAVFGRTDSSPRPAAQPFADLDPERPPF